MDYLKFSSLAYVICVLSSLSSLIATPSPSECDHCVATTSSGTSFRGVLNESVLKPDVKFCSFLGIRYGKAPVKENRFGKPVAELPTKGWYNAISDGKQCLQLTPDGVVGDEDCLFLNVFIPKAPYFLEPSHRLQITVVPFPTSTTVYSMFQRSSKCHSVLKPVLVYIHGGAFFEGSSSSGEISPDYLIEHDIVMVTFNYRLHVFGFLNLGIPGCGGNMGMRDQALALEWVQKNIKSFGGDPKRVTVMGQSAGAISTHLLTLSPLSRDLLHQTIIHSAISSVLVKNTTQAYSIDYAEHLGYLDDTKNRSAVLLFLKNLSPEKLMQGFATFLVELALTDDTFYASSQPFWPSEDSQLEDAFLPKSLEELSGQLDEQHIPVMAGQTSLDGTIAFYMSDAKNIIAYVQSHIDLYMKLYARDKLVDDTVISEVKNYYYHRRKDSDNELVSTIKLSQDFGFYDFYKQNFYRSRVVYNYQFCYDGSFQYYKKKYLQKYAALAKGVSHTEDLNYLFYSKDLFPKLTLTPSDKKVIHEMSWWWTNFVKTGNPNSAHDDIVLDWRPTTPEMSYYLKIDRESRLYDEEINEERRNFWRSLPEK